MPYGFLHVFVTLLRVTTFGTLVRGTPSSYTTAMTSGTVSFHEPPLTSGEGLAPEMSKRSSSYASSSNSSTLRPSTSAARSRHRRHPARASKWCPPLDSSRRVPSSRERRRHRPDLFRRLIKSSASSRRLGYVHRVRTASPPDLAYWSFSDASVPSCVAGRPQFLRQPWTIAPILAA